MVLYSLNSIASEPTEQREFLKTKLAILAPMIKGEKEFFVTTVTLSQNFTSREEKRNSEPLFSSSHFEDFQKDLEQTVITAYSKAFHLIVVQESLFNQHSDYPEGKNGQSKCTPMTSGERLSFLNKIKAFTQKYPNVLFSLNYMYEKERDKNKTLNKLNYFKDNIWPNIENVKDPATWYNIKILKHSLEKIEKTQKDKVKTLCNKTELYWDGSKVFSYRKIGLSGRLTETEEEGKLDSVGELDVFLDTSPDYVYLPGSKLHYAKHPLSQILSEIFSFGICHDHFLKVTSRLGGVKETSIAIERGEKKEKSKLYPNTRTIEINKNAYALETPLFYILQSATIDFDVQSLTHDFKGIVIHADSKVARSKVYYYGGYEVKNYKGETPVLSTGGEETRRFILKTFSLTGELQRLQFSSPLLEKALAQHPPAGPSSDRRADETTPLVGHDREEQSDSSCCEGCVIT